MASLGNRGECLDIGLINNMPDAALMSTERQLFDLLGAAAERLVVRLHFYTMEATPRSEWGRDYVRRYYRSTDDLVLGSLDGIVTGAEPRAARLTDEPYWTALTQIMDWARENTISSVYSCLAVHAAVLHMDGVERHKLPAKCIGVFAQTKTRDHPLMHYVPATFRIPHSRWNEVRQEAIASCWYSVLTKSAEAGVDCFVKQQKKSLFVHFQGHPEIRGPEPVGRKQKGHGPVPSGRERSLSDDTERLFWYEGGRDPDHLPAKSPFGQMSGVFRGFPRRSPGEESEKRLASAGQAHLPQLAAVHGVAACHTIKAAGPYRKEPNEADLGPQRIPRIRAPWVTAGGARRGPAP
jgi:homoserine O-succinyltransferase